MDTLCFEESHTSLTLRYFHTNVMTVSCVRSGQRGH